MRGWCLVIAVMAPGCLANPDSVWSGWRETPQVKDQKLDQVTWRKKLILRGIKEREFK